MGATLTLPSPASGRGRRWRAARASIYRISPSRTWRATIESLSSDFSSRPRRLRARPRRERSFTSPLLDAYELLLVEAMEGDHTLFIREEEAERAWEILTPLMASLPPVHPYAPSSWGPTEADDLIRPHGWHVSRRGDEAGSG